VPRHFKGEPSGDNLRIGVALARFNQAVTDRLGGTLTPRLDPDESRCCVVVDVG